MQVSVARKESLFSSINLDFLRSAAVLCVFAAHTIHAAGLKNIGSLGRFGVILFFVHTSLVLMASLERLDEGNPAGMTVSFWMRRIFRIYPLSILCVLAVVAFRVPASPGLSYSWVGWRHVISNLALAQSVTYSPNVLGVLWSLPLEIEMYILLPLIYLLIRRGMYRSLLMWPLAVIAALTIPNIVGRLSVFLYAPCFSAGVVAFELHKRTDAKLPSWLWPCAVCAAIFLFRPFDNDQIIGKLPRAWCLALGLAIMFPFCKEISLRFVAQVSHLIAKYSYGIYLSHSIVLWLAFCRLAGSPWALRIGVLAVGCVLLPVVAYHMVEHPLIQIGSRLARQLNTSNRSAGYSRIVNVSAIPTFEKLLARVLLCFCRKQDASSSPMDMVIYDQGDEFKQLERVFPNFIDSLKNKSVLDFGCGLGYQTVAIAKNGARESVGLDISRKRLAQAGELAGAITNVRFVDHLDPAVRFDVIVSQNAFEHFIDAPEVLDSMRRALAPGGRIFITFGPPWYAPWGAHLSFFCRLPWVQILFPESVVLEVRSLFRPTPHRSYGAIGLARMSAHKFERIVERSGLKTADIRYDCVKRQNWVRFTPLRELFVNQISCVLTEPRPL
jgi:peptidoglycan/LPS O-acetylase OafA/YrhL/SAM-dependent methyltransferase